MKILVTGATGFIGGSVAAGLMAAGHEVIGLVRSAERAAQAGQHGMKTVIGSLDDHAMLARETSACDAVVNAADANDAGSALAMLEALAGSDKLFLHTSGSSVIGTRAKGEAVEAIYDETTPFEPSPARVGRATLNREILAYADKRVRAVIICPSLIYGCGHGVNKNSMQIPWLIDLARKVGAAQHIGSGGNIWSNVHIDDLIDLYLLAMELAPPGAFYYAENGENSMLQVCQSIARMLGLSTPVQSISVEQAASHWGEGPAHDTMGSNSRVRAIRARQELNWRPGALPLLEEIERGCYSVA
ncbi:MAG: NAD-dependent epimerase/dehydratase family protein [Burkholderiaceae bacterium]